MSTAPFGVGGKPRRLRPTVENTPRICIGDLARSLYTGLARVGTVNVVINGKPEVLDVVCDPRNYGGDGQWFFLCEKCSKKVMHLYLRNERLACRECSGVTYASRCSRRRGLNRVCRLRKKIGALPSPLAPLPSRPRYVRRDYWTREVAKLAAAEAVIAAQLHAIVPRVRRRLKHDRHRDSGA